MNQDHNITEEARAAMEAQRSPDDPEAKTLLRAAVRDGRAALRAHREAATAGIAAQTGAIPPRDGAL